MLRQNGGSNKRLGLARLSTSNFFTISNSGNWGMGRSTKSSSLSSISSNSDCYDNPVVDPEYIMQLVNDVRKFADVLLYLKEAILSEGMPVDFYPKFLGFLKLPHLYSYGFIYCLLWLSSPLLLPFIAPPVHDGCGKWWLLLWVLCFLIRTLQSVS